MKEGWEVKKLGEVCDIIMGQSPKGSTYNTENIGMPLINGPVEFGEGPFGLTKKNRFTSEPTKECQEGDLILCVRGSTTGKINIAAFDACIGRGVAAIRFSSNQKFLNYFIRYNQQYIYSIGTGATFPNVSGKQLSTIDFPIPLPQEQKQIVSILDKAFAAIEQARANVQQNLENARELFQSELNAIFSQKGEGWEEKRLGDQQILEIIDGDRGKNYPKKKDYLVDGHCVFLNTGNVRKDGFDFSSVVYISKERDQLLRKGKLKRNDVVLTTRGTIGNLGIFNEEIPFHEIRINSGMLILRSTNHLHPEYLFYALQTPAFNQQVINNTSGAAQPQLPIKTLVNLSIQVPSNKVLQKEIIQKAKKLKVVTDSLQSHYQQKLDELDELKQSLLQQAFSGQLT